MALNGYYKSGLGLFIDNHGEWTDENGNVVSESFLISQGAKVMKAYKLKANSWEFAKDDIFAAHQSAGDNFKFISDTQIKFLIAEFVEQTAYFSEVQYLPQYLVS
jgi:uncharacterized sporulation protein YeaH/YhbH (DUF444 family)